MWSITRISKLFLLKTLTVDAWFLCRHLRRGTFRICGHAAGNSARTNATEPSRSSTSVLGPWNLGDSVTLLQDGEYKSGIIQESRGRGWFTFHDSETNTSIKCRSSQLRRAQKNIVDEIRHNNPSITLSISGPQNA